MGKLMTRLEKQLTTEHKKDAEDCIKIYNTLKERTGGVWESQWRPLAGVTFKGYPSDERRYKPTSMGYTFLKGLEKTPVEEKMYSREEVKGLLNDYGHHVASVFAECDCTGSSINGIISEEEWIKENL